MDARGYSHRDLASKLNIDHASITRAMALLTLPTPIQEAVNAGEIRPQTAYELSRVDDPGEQAQLAEEARAGRLTRNEIRERVASKPKGRGGETPSKARAASKAASRFDRPIMTASGYRVTLERRKKGVDLLAIVEALEEVLAIARGELAPAEDDEAA
jgi:hypothetical protein